jgi:hypothetical protein
LGIKKRLHRKNIQKDLGEGGYRKLSSIAKPNESRIFTALSQQHYMTPLLKALIGFITEKDPVLAMLEWMAQQMMLIEAEVGAEKGRHSKRPEEVLFREESAKVTRLGAIYLYIPKLR